MTATVHEAYEQAALRLFRDAEHLANDGRIDSAAHFIGFAAECAIKHAVRELRPGQDVPHKHIPELIEHAKKCLKGRGLHQRLLSLISQADYFAGWNVNLRYAPDSTVNVEAYKSWRHHTTRTFGAVGLRKTA